MKKSNYASESSFVSSRVERLASHLRDSIARGKVQNPLPNTRQWSAQLGVGQGTLLGAIRILSNEGLVRRRYRMGVELSSKTEAVAPIDQSLRVVRWLYYGRDYSDVSFAAEIFLAISQRLEVHGIRFVVEKCDAGRLRTIHRKGGRPSEMLVLVALPKQFQILFASFKKTALILDLPFPGIQLPFISIDLLSAVHHAIHMLARRGFSRISLILKEGSRSRKLLAEYFSQVCSESLHPIRGDVFCLPFELREQNAATMRLVSTMSGRRALIVVDPIPVGLLITALMKKGVDVPGEVEVVAMNTMMHNVRVVPMPIYYSYPVERLAKTITQAATHFFKQGNIPPLRKLISLEMVADR